MEDKKLDPQEQTSVIEVDDGLNLEDHRVSQDFENDVNVKKAITSIPVRRPDKQNFIRIHPDKEMSDEAYALKIEKDNEFYVLSSNLRSEVAEHVFRIALFTTINRSGDLCLWPIKLPGPDGKLNSWHQSAFEAVEIGKTKWIRLSPNQANGVYDVVIALDNLPDPTWPDMDFQEIFRLAFKNHNIRDQNHPVLNQLRGKL